MLLIFYSYHRQVGKRRGKSKGQIFQEERKTRIKQILEKLQTMVRIVSAIEVYLKILCIMQAAHMYFVASGN